MSPYREPANMKPEVRREFRKTMEWLDNIIEGGSDVRFARVQRRLRNVEIAFVLLAILHVIEFAILAARP